MTASLDLQDVAGRLKRCPFLKGYWFVLFSHHGAQARNWEPVLASEPPALPMTIFEEVLELAVMTDRQAVQLSRAGLFVFAIPLLAGDSQLCLAGAGSRDRVLNLGEIEGLARFMARNPVDLLEHIQNYPVSSKTEVEDIAQRTTDAVRAMERESGHAAQHEGIADRVAAVAAISSAIDTLTTCDLTISLFLDSLIVVFEIPRIAVVLTRQAVAKLMPSEKWSHPSAITKIVSHINGLGHTDLPEKHFMLPGDVPFLAEMGAKRAICFRFWEADSALVALLDVEVSDTDISLIELLNSRVATRLRQLMHEDQLSQVNSRSQSILSLMRCTLLEEEKFFDCLLTTATGLVGATSGSLLAMDKDGRELRVASAQGISTHLSGNFKIKLGEGIAGMVAASGVPLLVEDIETDLRTARHNRARFTTKSFLSLPLRKDERVIGVLNISEKADGGPFTIRDLETLGFFVDQAAGLMDHILAKRRGRNGSLATTGELTGVCSKEILLPMLQEEINRSKRRNRPITLVMVGFVPDAASNADAAAMDKAIKVLGERLENSLRDTDTVARYGASVFCATLTETGREEADSVIARMTNICSDLAAGFVSSLKVAANIGVSSFPEDGASAADLVNKAEKEMVAFTVGTNGAPDSYMQPRSLHNYDFKVYRSRSLLPAVRGRETMDNPSGGRQVLHLYTDSPSGQLELLK